MPVALPLIFLGLRLAAIQVVSTATIAAYVGLGGLGRYIIDGQASRNFAELGAGALAGVPIRHRHRGLLPDLPADPGVPRRTGPDEDRVTPNHRPGRRPCVRRPKGP